jgi:hypothetical protein
VPLVIDERPNPPSAISPGIESHHWAALIALQKGDYEAALHQIEHIIEGVSGDHLLAMESTRSDIRRGRIHEARHRIELMLTSKSAPPISSAQAHFRLALLAIDAGSLSDAKHHLRHVLEEEGADSGVDAVLATVEDDRLGDAQRLLRGLLAESVDADVGRTTCAESAHIHKTSADGTLAVAVVVDEAWGEDHGGDPWPAADALVASANEALHTSGIRLRVASRAGWSVQSPDSLAGELTKIDSSRHDRPPEVLIVFLTGASYAETADGHYTSTRHAAAVRHSPNEPERDVLVLLHELGHHLGLTHRHGTYMQPHGFPPATDWSVCQLEFLQGLRQI